MSAALCSGSMRGTSKENQLGKMARRVLDLFAFLGLILVVTGAPSDPQVGTSPLPSQDPTLSSSTSTPGLNNNVATTISSIENNVTTAGNQLEKKEEIGEERTKDEKENLDKQVIQKNETEKIGNKVNLGEKQKKNSKEGIEMTTQGSKMTEVAEDSGTGETKMKDEETIIPLPSEVNVKKRTKDEEVEKNVPIALPQKETLKGYTRPDGTYIIEDTAGTPCVMAYFKAKLTIYYPTDREKEKYKSTIVSPPNDVKVSGKCDRDSLVAILDLAWDQGTFSIKFAFDDLTDSWFVDQFLFTFDTTMSAYPGADKDEIVLIKSIEDKRFWTTSHARSFRCLLLHDVSLLDEDDTYSGTIHFDEARVQALTKTSNFKTPKHCIHRVHRDEMVPITVGGMLAGSTLLTVAAYGVFRYFKVKKFQYGTME